MSSPFRILEILLCSLIGFLPYVLLMIYPFRNRLRFGNGLTAGLTALAAILTMGCDLAAGVGTIGNTGLVILLNLVIKILLCLALVKAPVGKTAFTALSASLLAIGISAVANGVEMFLFSDTAAEIYSWSYLLAYAVLELLVLIPCALALAKCLAPTMLGAADAPWNSACIVPAAVVAIGCILLCFGAAAWLTAIILVVLTVGGCILVMQMLKNAGVEAITVELDLKPAPKPAPKAQEPAEPRKKKEITLPKHESKKAAVTAPQNEPFSAQLASAQYDSLQARIAESERYHQELRRHIDTMSYHLNNQDYDKLRTQFTALQSQFPKNAPVIYCDNTSVSPVLAYFNQQAAYCGAKMVCDVQLAQQSPAVNEDLALLVGNLLDNAVDACAAQRSSDRRIWITCRMEHHTLHLTVENTFDIRKDNNTSLQVCRQIAEGRKGSLTITDVNSICKTEVTMKL